MWSDLFKLFTYAFTQDPLAKKADVREFPTAGVSSPDSILDLRNLETLSQGGAFIRVQNELVDTTTATNRTNRYKEYDRLILSVPEIEMAMTVFADEACVAGTTEISTLYDGVKTIEWLANNKANEKFPVYCFDFKKEDYTIGWGYAPRFVKFADTVKIVLDNGRVEIVTPDHEILKRDGEYAYAGDLKFSDELMPFYKIKSNPNYNRIKTNQFPRIFTFEKGWIHERQFIDEWRLGKDQEQYERANHVARLIAKGLNIGKLVRQVGHEWTIIDAWLKKHGFSYQEFKKLSKNPDRRRVIGIFPNQKTAVYDLSVEEHKNFCTTSCVMHNCQKDEDGRCFKIHCANEDIVDELNFVMYHRDMLNLDQRTMWDKAKRLFIKGDLFWEVVINPDNPKEGVYKINDLPAETMFRIETIKGKVLEYQQSKEAPDYQAIIKSPIQSATEAELQQCTAIRFAPEQVIHLRIGDYRKTFYPYGVSLIEAARGPAHQLRMMEDSMVVYRLCLAGDSRIRTNEGWKYIKDIKLGETVFTLDRNTFDIVKSDVIWWVNNGKQKVYKVKSKHNEVQGNDTHPILVNRDGVIGYVDIKDIIPGKDKFLNITRDDEVEIELPCLKKQKWTRLTKSCREGLTTYFKNELPAHKFRMNYWQLNEFTTCGNATYPVDAAKEMCNTLGLKYINLQRNKNYNTPRRDQFNLPRVVTEDFAKLFGFLIGDGSIRATNYNSCTQLNFTCGTDNKQNAYYARLLKKFFGKIRFSKETRSKCPGKFEVDSKYACYLFLRMGYIPGAKNKRIPSWVFMAKKSIRKAFIQGLADADANIRRLRTGLWTAEFAMCNKQLIEDIKELWHSIGLASGHIRTRVRKGGHYIERDRQMPETVSHEVYISEKPLDKYELIESVEYVNDQDIFDITVNNPSHNIVVNGVVTSQTRAPERRCFYIDIGQLPPYKAEAFMDRIKDQFRKKKVPRNQYASGGASAVEERWHAPSADEDYWIPIRPQSNTRIDTLPGAQNLGEIDDCVYFRNKLYIALNFPKNYFSLEDPNATRITLSAQDVKFARMIERLQSHIEEALYQIADKHLKLRGFPPESYEDLIIKMTPPSDWRELSRAEIVTNRINNANSLKGSQLMGDFDILTKWMKYNEDEAKEMMARIKVQKLEDLKLQVLAQNPVLLGVGIPGQGGEQEIGAEPGGPSPALGAPPGGMPPTGAVPGGAPGGMPPAGPPMPPPPNDMIPPAGQGKPLPKVSEEDAIKYDMEIQDYESEIDHQDIDFTDTEG